MTIRSRLARLERDLRDQGPRRGDDRIELLTDEQRADRTGEFLWLTPDWDGHSRLLAKNPSTAHKAVAFRRWHLASKAARAGGQTTYDAGLRPQAMAVWLTIKPDMLELERKHGTWISLEPAPADEAPTPEEFAQLPVEERIRVLRSQASWPGYSSKIGPGSTPRQRRER